MKLNNLNFFEFSRKQISLSSEVISSCIHVSYVYFYFHLFCDSSRILRKRSTKYTAISSTSLPMNLLELSNYNKQPTTFFQSSNIINILQLSNQDTSSCLIFLFSSLAWFSWNCQNLKKKRIQSLPIKKTPIKLNL